MKIALNRGWDFYFDKNKDEKVVVDIPHTVKETPFNSFDESIYQTVCKYTKTIELTEEMKDKTLILHFAGVAHKAEVFVNGKLKGAHTCGYTAFDVDITKAAFENMKKPGEIAISSDVKKDNAAATSEEKKEDSDKKEEPVKTSDVKDEEKKPEEKKDETAAAATESTDNKDTADSEENEDLKVETELANDKDTTVKKPKKRGRKSAAEIAEEEEAARKAEEEARRKAEEEAERKREEEIQRKAAEILRKAEEAERREEEERKRKEEEEKLKQQAAAEGKSGVIGLCVIEVIVDTREDLNQPPFGNVIDYMTYGGIYREVHLEVKNKLYVKDAYFCFNQMDIYGGMLHTKLMLSSEPKDDICFGVKVADTNGLVVGDGHGQFGVVKETLNKAKISLADIAKLASASSSAASAAGASNAVSTMAAIDAAAAALAAKGKDAALLDTEEDKEKKDADSSLGSGSKFSGFGLEADMGIPGLDSVGLGTVGIGLAKKVELSDNVISDVEGFSHNCDLRLTDVVLWRPENPMMYTVTVEIYTEQDGKKTVLDEMTTKIGLRSIEWKETGFYLNGKKYKLRGLNRHQSYPYVGYAMPDRLQREDVKILKEELGVNVVRTSHYPQAQSFYEACDDAGIFVITEIPGWQHIGDAEWKKQAVQNVKEMVCQYRNHPSVILWGVRINESQDDDDFYKQTNETARSLAPLDFMGGTRNFAKSNLLEDVYTYNDFLYDGKHKGAAAKKDITPDPKKPYIITEFNGHMFPTKSSDTEEHRVEQALRHATVINEICWQEDIAGCLGWCMFDYNTHKGFGSGDRICYHGVMDMFRNPKYAAAFYRSQSDISDVMEVASNMDIGDYPAEGLFKVYVFTNLDSVKFYKGGVYIGEFFPDKATYGNLPHPPIIIDDFIGNQLVEKEGYTKEQSDKIKEYMYAVMKYGIDSLPMKEKFSFMRLKLSNEKLWEYWYKYIGCWGDKERRYEFIGIKDGAEIIKTVRTAADTMVPELDIKVGSTELADGDTYDATAVRIRLTDQFGKVLSYTFEDISFETEGCISVIGPKVGVLRGGMGGTYVRTTGKGEGTLTIRFRDIEKKITFTVK